MRLASFTSLLTVCFSAALLSGSGGVAGASATKQTVSGPHVHDNLTVFFIHGPSAAGPVPLTLAEAMAKGTATVIETGSVNELRIENTGTEDVFIQAGDIVKGGKQDRVLTVSLLLPAKSGKVPIASFCVEQGRWTTRGKEDAGKFASAAEAMPSRAAKLAMRAPVTSNPTTTASSGLVTAGQLSGRNGTIRQGVAHGDETSKRQKKVWDEVANVQAALSARLGASVSAAQSASSLQLSLENAKLKEARGGYLKVLEPLAQSREDIVGFVFAVNGRINSADLYPSNALFRKMWGKLLNASITEAIGERGQAASGQTDVKAVEAFLATATAGKAEDKTIAGIMQQETRDGEQALYVEAKRKDGQWVHRNYLAK
jgi:hypothetical protein